MANLATKAAAEDGRRLTIHAPLIGMIVVTALLTWSIAEFVWRWRTLWGSTPAEA